MKKCLTARHKFCLSKYLRQVRRLKQAIKHLTLFNFSCTDGTRPSHCGRKKEGWLEVQVGSTDGKVTRLSLCLCIHPSFCLSCCLCVSLSLFHLFYFFSLSSIVFFFLSYITFLLNLKSQNQRKGALKIS